VKPSIMIIAKAPEPGRSKTRLSPPCTPGQAAQLAEAALADTLEAVSGTGIARRRLVLEGEPGDWLPPGFEVVRQVTGGLGDRLAAAFAGIGGPALLIGMDTPQVTAEMLDDGIARLERPGTDAVLGLCLDGGYWAIGFDGQRPGVFDAVPMSVETTGQKQLERMRALGMVVDLLPELADVDYYDDALAAARERPAGRFASVLGQMEIAGV
jgi:rSAM/selenodomain-associated transferase 1